MIANNIITLKVTKCVSLLLMNQSHFMLKGSLRLYDKIHRVSNLLREKIRRVRTGLATVQRRFLTYCCNLPLESLSWYERTLVHLIVPMFICT